MLIEAVVGSADLKAAVNSSPVSALIDLGLASSEASQNISASIAAAFSAPSVSTGR